MKIYYKDKDIAVCEKPYGVSSQLSDRDNMISYLEDELGREVYPVHRLDITTTGLIVYALNKKSAAIMSDAVARGELLKEYYAIVHGICEPCGELNDLLYHDRIKNKSFVVKTERKGAKRAQLYFKTVDTAVHNEIKLSLVKIRLVTGRTHQIRVQLSNDGHALYGDGKYGARDNDNIKLHSSQLSFKHPITKKEMKFTSLPQGEMWDIFKISE